jgi:serine/threonine protein kinase
VKKLNPFAVKITRDDDEEKKMANRNEYNLTKDLSHLNILKVRELIENEVSGEMHLVMQYIDGQEILDQIAEQPQEFYTELQAKSIFE